MEPNLSSSALGGRMTCPGCGRDVNYVTIKSHCYQEVAIVDVDTDGKMVLGDWGSLDVVGSFIEVRCRCGFILPLESFSIEEGV